MSTRYVGTYRMDFAKQTYSHELAMYLGTDYLLAEFVLEGRELQSLRSHPYVLEKCGLLLKFSRVMN